MRQKSEQEILHKMAAYCSIAERSKQEIINKIQKEELDRDAINRIITYLEKENFLNEERYARSFVNDKFRFNKWGKIKINYELQKKNIPSSIRTEVLNEIDEEVYISTLHAILKEKKKSVKGKNDPDIFNKLLRFGAGRGFESHYIVKALKSIVNNNEYDDME